MRTSRHWRGVAAIWAVWTVVAVVSASEGHLFRVSRGLPSAWQEQLAGSLSSCWLWAVFTPWIVALTRRFRPERRNWRALLPLHAAFALGFSLADVGADLALGAWLPLLRTRTGSLVSEFLGQTFLNLFSYFAVLAVAYAAHYHALYLERRLAASRLEAQLLQARLRTLEMQLRPHFLYNTLHTVAALVRAGRNDEAVRTIAGFSDLLRASLRVDRRNEVPLRQELAFIRRYLAIEQIRFHQRLRTRVAADRDSLDGLVPTLILQPLVENAIRHGVERRATPGRVEVSAERRNGTLVLRVRDTGSAERMSEGRPGSSIGLANTRARLRFLYGEHYRFELNDDAGGVVALIELPFHRVPLRHAADPHPDR